MLPAADGPDTAPLLLGLGSNLGEPLTLLREAVERLSAVLGPLRPSSVFRTAPVGHADQPDFFNLVCAGRSDLPAGEVLAACQRVERELGRVRSFPNAPRTIDVDILAHGGRVLDTAELVLPHPRLHLRAFVLLPLAEIEPGWRHPRLGLTPAEMIAAAGPLERAERVGDLGA